MSHRLSLSSHRLSPIRVPAISSRSSSSLVCIRTIKCCSLRSPSLAVDETKFPSSFKEGKFNFLYACIFSNQLTPVLAYRCLVKEDDRESPSFLYESIEPGFQTLTVGRYSVVGAQPAIEIVAKGNAVTIVDHGNGSVTEQVVDDPMTIPRSI
ncbi:hypothetical protein F0562_015420 [Nyssa sinensis]|uniref:Anthranilate synthase component I N-terminal domain-containing protein n=1 Tax=Nyssa sinensis TaxID=561372 RepID=A0A5J4ZK50_9ASTE|nr:hypothetical protein F0562_015420 [Nyssa sinensis]